MAAEGNKLDIVECAYEAEDQEDAWFGAIAKTLSASVDGAVGSYIFEVRNEGGQPTLARHWAESPEIGAQLQRSFSELPREMLAFAFAQPLIATTGREFFTKAEFPFPGRSSLGPSQASAPRTCSRSAATIPSATACASACCWPG